LELSICERYLGVCHEEVTKMYWRGTHFSPCG